MSRTGLKAEELVCKKIKNKGGKVKARQNTTLPGNADVVAEWKNSGRAWRVQVKSTSQKGKNPAWPPAENLGNLKSTATRNGETAVVAWVFSDNSIEFKSAKDGRTLSL